MASCWFASEVQFAVCKLRLAMSLMVIVASLAYRRNHEDCRIQKIDLQFASRDIIEETQHSRNPDSESTGNSTTADGGRITPKVRFNTSRSRGTKSAFKYLCVFNHMAQSSPKESE